MDLFLLLQTPDIAIRARHLPGCLSVIADRLSRLNQPITESPPRSSEPYIRDMGNSSSGNVRYSPQHASSPVYVSSFGASSTGYRSLSQDWHGRSMYMFPPFPLLSKVIQKLMTTQEGEVILTAPRSS